MRDKRSKRIQNSEIKAANKRVQNEFFSRAKREPASDLLEPCQNEKLRGESSLFLLVGNKNRFNIIFTL